MQEQHNVQQTPQKISDNEKAILQQLVAQEFKQQRYRWVIVALMGFCLLINGFANNAIIPIASKIATVYSLSSVYVNAPVIASFLIYSISNFPANFIIDKYGLRISFLIGSGLYALGLLLYTLINKGYYFVLIGSILVALGQPFIVNCPAKVATFWFTSKNRTFGTSIMIGTNLLSIGTSFIMPTIAVGQYSFGEKAKDQIFYLYAIYFFLAALTFIFVFIFMKAKPKQAPSLGAEYQKSGLKESLQILKKDRNLWLFLLAYILVYGTVIALGSCANQLFKPYGFTDIEIGVCAIVMLLLGVAGSIFFSIYIKKTGNYKQCIRIIAVLSFSGMAILFAWLNISAIYFVTVILLGSMGFFCTPIIPICYDLGCELAFPMGEAQITGLLNGGALLYTFITSLIISAAIGFGTKTKSLTVEIIFLVFMLFGSFLFFKVKINLKRKNLESGNTQNLDQSKISQIAKHHHELHEHQHENQPHKQKNIEMISTTRDSQDTDKQINNTKYQNFVEERDDMI